MAFRFLHPVCNILSGENFCLRAAPDDQAEIVVLPVCIVRIDQICVSRIIGTDPGFLKRPFLPGTARETLQRNRSAVVSKI